MKTSRVKVTIGIPAYNEEANIGELIAHLLSQNGSGYKLDRIIVSSDGSTDRTVAIVNSINDKRVTLIDNKKRAGLGRGLNQIVKEANSEVLVLVDADIAIEDKSFINKLIEPVTKDEKDLTSCKIKEKNPQNFIERTLYVSMRLKENLFESYRGGDNLFTCHGPARAMSKKMYKKIFFPEGKGNDMYSYLYAKANGFFFKYVRNISVYYKLPGNMEDHKKQSLRFFASIDSQRNYFSDDLLESETKIRLPSYISGAVKSIPLFFRYPMHIAFYVLLNAYLKVSSFKKFEQSNLWSIAKSSKNLRI